MTEDEAIRLLCLARIDHELWFKAWLDDPSPENKMRWQTSVRQLRMARQQAHEVDSATLAAEVSHERWLRSQRRNQQRYRDEERRLLLAGDLVDDVVGRDEGEDPSEA